jgi:hypothetical protein
LIYRTHADRVVLRPARRAPAERLRGDGVAASTAPSSTAALG